jgi:hypothetical protein
MFDQVSYLSTQALLHNRQDAALQASKLYERTLSGHLLRRIGERLRGHARRLLNLETLQASLRVRDAHFAGARFVAIARIRGSEGRVEDFDGDFHPLNPASKGRWIGVATARLRGETLPPVELIQVGDVYFVRDGHHRISVARALGQREIDALVTVWDVAGPRRAGERDGLPTAA